jgi:glycopeptide antibiotics resistance protein
MLDGASCPTFFFVMINRVATVAWALVILVLCAIPGRDLPNISWLALLAFDKWVHAGIFFVLVLLFLRANVLELKSQIVVARMGLAAMIVYGGLLEVMQGALFEERTADVYDFIANSFGAVLGFVLFSRLIKKFPILIRPIKL